MKTNVDSCSRKLERLAMLPDTVANVVMEVSEYEQEPISAEAGIGPSAGGTAASGGKTGQNTGGCGKAGEGSDRGF